MLSPPSVSFTILDGGLSEGTVPPVDGPFWLFGLTSSGTANSPLLTTQPSTVKSSLGYGIGVEAALQALNKEVNEISFVKIDPTDQTAGVYGSITVTSQGAGITVTGDSTVKPADDWEPIILWTAGCTIGVTGGKYKYSLDNGGKYSGERELGTDTSITLPNGGGKYNLVGKELTTLVARYADVRTQVLAHAAGTGTYHGSADGGPYTITTPTNDATVLLCADDLLTVAAAHVVKVSGSPAIHGAADATAQTAIAALTAPSTRAEAITFIEEFVEIFFGDEDGTTNSGHTVRTASSIHGAKDTTNVLTADPAIAGDVVAGDYFSLTTTAPRWDLDQLLASLDIFAASVAAFSGVIEIVGNILTSAEAQAIEDKLEEMSDPNRDVRAVGHYRPRNAGESQQAYVAAFLAAHPIAQRSGRKGRLHLTASMYIPSQLSPGSTSVRPFSFVVAPRMSRMPYATHPIYRPAVGTFSGALRAPNGTDVLPRACDEKSEPIYTPAGLWAPMMRGATAIVSSKGVSLAEDGSDFAQIQYGRIIDAVKRLEQAEMEDRLGQGVVPKPGTVYIDPNEKKRIEEARKKRILDVFGGEKGQIVNARVVIDPASVVSGSGDKVLYEDVYVTPPGYIEIVVGRLQFAL
jgi:hypothetical protein